MTAEFWTCAIEAKMATIKGWCLIWTKDHINYGEDPVQAIKDLKNENG